MSEEKFEYREHQGEPEHEEFPGPETHQAPWVFWVTIACASAFGFFVILLHLIFHS